MPNGNTIGRAARTSLAVLLMLAFAAVFAAAVLAAPPALSTEPAAPDGANGWFRTLPTVTIGPPSPGSYTLYKWLPAGPMTVYTAPFKLGTNTYGQPTMKFGYGVTTASFDESATCAFKIDPVVPVITGLTNTAGIPATTWTNSSDATFTVQYTELHSGIQGYSYVMAQTQPPVDTVIEGGAPPIVLHGLYTGRWYLQVRAVDNAGNWSTVVARQHLVDRIPPVTSDNVLPEYEGTATVSAFAADAHSGVASIQTRLDTAPLSSGSQRTTTATGTHEFGYRASDVAGNVSAETTAGFVVMPNEPPVTTIHATDESALPILAMGPDDPWHQAAKFTLSATDNSSGVYRTYYNIDGGFPAEYVSEVSVSGPGTHTVDYWSVDAAGNVEPFKTATLKIDADPPVFSQDMSSPAEGTSTVNYSAADALSGLTGTVTVLVDGNVWLAGSPVVITTPGAHVIQLDADDAAGNHATSYLWPTVIANEPPTTTVLGLAGKYVTSQDFELFATDNCSGVAWVRYRLDGGATEDYYGPVSVSKEGTTAIEYWSVDSVGNVETTKGPAYAMVDRTPPVTLTKTWSPRVGSTTFMLTATDAFVPVDHISYRLDGGAVTTYTAPVTSSVKGMHTLSYWAVDELGNVEAPKTLVFSVARMPTKFAVRVYPTSVISGSYTTMSGVLTSADGVIRGSRNVSLWTSVMGGTWTKVGPAAYDPATGAYRATRKVSANQRLQLRFTGDSENLACVSAPISVGCRVYISAPVTPWFNRVGRYVVVYGTMWPRHAIGTRVATLYCYRYEDGRWVLRKTVGANAYYASTGTKYGAFVTLPLAGRWRIVAVHSDAAHSRSVSPGRVLLAQ